MKILAIFYFFFLLLQAEFCPQNYDPGLKYPCAGTFFLGLEENLLPSLKNKLVLQELLTLPEALIKRKSSKVESSLMREECKYRPVKFILDAYKTSSEYSIRFDGTDFPGGVYLYRLEAGGLTHTKKFLLLK